MMTVRLRLVGLAWRWLTRDRQEPPASVSRLPLRCQWTDCDINRHMNNSRYLALMDLGRYHFMLVSGLGKEVLKRKWAPVVVRIAIDYKKSLEPGDRFVLETSHGGVGTKSATLVQRFWRGDELVAEAQVTALMLHRGKSVELAPLWESMAHLLPAAAAGSGDC